MAVDGYRCLLAPALVAAAGPEGDLGSMVRTLLGSDGVIARLRERPRRIEVIRAGTAAPIEVVRKAFRRDAWRARVERALGAADRAERSWHAAHALTAAGIPTAPPLFLALPTAPSDPRSSYYGCRHLAGALEVRAVVDAINRRRPLPREVGPEVGPIFRATGELTRRLHRAGIWHRDLTAGNLLLWPWPDRQAALHLIDLDRARLEQRIELIVRIRELGRFPIRAGLERDQFLAGYHAPGPVPAVDAILDAIHHRTYRFRKWLRFRSKRRLRRLAAALWGER